MNRNRQINYYAIRPTKRLADVVRYFWVFEGHASTHAPYVHSTVASGCPELLFHYSGTFNELTSDDRMTSSFTTGIHAQTNRHRAFVINQPFGIFGAYLYPYALSVLFDIPAIELTNELPDLCSIVKARDNDIEDRMFNAIDNTERVSIITTFLENKLKEPKRPTIARAVRTVLDTKGMVNVNDLASQCSLSLRQFERTFKEEAGFAPKTYARIARFSAAVEGMVSRKMTLTELAFDLGYYDQSHFIADFRAFTGTSPGSWPVSQP